MAFKDKQKKKLYLREWRKQNKHRISEINRVQYQRNRYARMEYQRQINRKKKKMVFEAYGNKCVCCGEPNYCFLTMDHINNDGAEHRRQIGNGRNSFYNWIIKNNFPDSLQILCWNCNESKEHDPEGHIAVHPNAVLVHGTRDHTESSHAGSDGQIYIQGSLWRERRGKEAN